MGLKWPFKKKGKSFLGIDVGTSEIRVVELSRYGEQQKLENYGSLYLPYSYFISPRIIKKGGMVFSSKRFAEIIATVLRESNIESKRAAFSIPDFSTLFTTFTLPPMAEKEIPQAVKFEARRHVPLPLSEVTLDWVITKGGTPINNKQELEILLVVVPNRVIEQYRRMAELCHLDLISLEPEIFALERALVKDKKKIFCLIDIGARSTTCSIVDKKVVRASYSFDIGGNDLTERLTKSLGLGYKEAEDLKAKQGLMAGQENIASVLKTLLTSMIAEISRVVENFYEREGKEIEVFIVSGGSASLPGLKEYFAQHFKKEIRIAFPFRDMVYPAILEEELRRIGPGFSISVGVALRGLE